jgi:hypothetical protein
MIIFYCYYSQKLFIFEDILLKTELDDLTAIKYKKGFQNLVCFKTTHQLNFKIHFLNRLNFTTKQNLKKDIKSFDHSKKLVLNIQK